MMISPSACRMGLVTTSRRKIGTVLTGSSTLGGRRAFLTASSKSSSLVDASVVAPETKSLWTPRSPIFRRRWKSSRAAAVYDTDSDDQDDLEVRTKGLAAAAQLRATSASSAELSHEEAWMINLGRGDDNEWLTGPREDEWFTGIHPRDCPGVDAKGKIRSLPLPNLSCVTRHAAKEYFDNSWTLYETLFAGLNGEEYFYRPPVHGLRHPQIFYYGHTACLYVNKLRVSGVLDKPVNPYFESIFEVGVDEMLWDDMHKNDMLWPIVSEVHEYKKKVYETVVDAIMNHPSLEPAAGEEGVKVDQSHPMWALFLGFEHERIHFETSSVLFREAPYHLVQTPTNWPPMHPSATEQKSYPPVTSNPVEGKDYPPNKMIPVNQGAVDLGKPADFPSFGWDNEYGERNVSVPPFQASEHMITNGEYYQFVQEGGYRNRQYWCEDSWHWRTHRNMKWPFFWEPAGPAGTNEFNLRTIFDIVSMPWDWPVDVNYYEAQAYCRWKTEKDGSPTSRPYRILTEAEHHLIRHRDHGLEAARKDAGADKVMVTSGKDFAKGETATNLNLAYSSQNPVDFFPPSQTGHRDTTGSAWEWTEDHFNPLKGFEVHHVYDDFSTPCFDGKHSMIVGGSFMSTGDEASTFARFHFRPHFLQHSGFRLVASDDPAPATHLFAGNFGGQVAAAAAATQQPPSEQQDSDNVYETDTSLHMYLGLHYPKSGEAEGVAPILPHSGAPSHGLFFPQRVARLLKSLEPERSNNSALDIGCAVGGASFELAKTFDRVDAFDFSESFVNGAKRMQNIAQEDIAFNVPVEAELFEQVKAVHDDGVTPDVLSKVNFFAGDAQRIAEMNATGQIATYDGVVMSNLLCRLPDPMACIDGLPCIVNKGGVVVMVTPFSWLLEFTPRSKWLGGFYDPVSKDPIYSKDVLQEMMEDRGFEKIHEEEMPLVIREHQRKYQYIVSEATGWRKKE
ncbi:Hercynine oxygenase [Seminavis robusta]|uniref:Hercynine oxygenase n=1 Tax=Seminavis robusta TaxID=568900 RepID=A0A9N8HPD6_9STRA|nr:Hercynine oxygenase [Seminavis robusta]|eukprot:Sro1318_g262190.1 Hercynine oxygenase (958) ;mRNA; r:7422-10492